MARFSALAALFGVGLLIAVVVPAVGRADTTTVTTTEPATTEFETTTVQQTTTAAATTVVTTATVPPTTTAPTTTFSETAEPGSETPTWVWVLVAILGAAVVGLLVYVFTRPGPGGPPGPPPPNPPADHWPE